MDTEVSVYLLLTEICKCFMLTSHLIQVYENHAAKTFKPVCD